MRLSVCGHLGTVESNRSGTRWHIIHTHEAHPDWSHRRVGAAVGVDHKAVKLWLTVHKNTGDVQDRLRSGRKPVIAKAALSKLRSAAIKKHSAVKFSASRLSKALQTEMVQLQACERFPGL